MKKVIEKYNALQSMMQTKLKDERGATMVEYALMVALIAVVCIATVELVGTSANAMFEQIRVGLQ